MSFVSLWCLFFTLYVCTLVHAAVDPIIIKGTKFFYQGNGSQFFIKGVAYQPNPSREGLASLDDFIDPLSDPNGCIRDVPFLQALGINVIRVYTVRADQDHTQCMNTMANAGIYVMVDLASPRQNISAALPAWNLATYTRYTSVIDLLANYTNTLGFFVGNEVATSGSHPLGDTYLDAYIKAAARDVKLYIAKMNYRIIPLGYASGVSGSPSYNEIHTNEARYFNCGPTEDKVDFLGLNIYSWCGESTYTTSGYNVETAYFSNYSIPIFFSEYGCVISNLSRFGEVQALYGPLMTPVFSGGIAYRYFGTTADTTTGNNYGLVNIVNSDVEPEAAYTSLQSQLAANIPSSTAISSYTPTNTVSDSCPTVVANGWQASEKLPSTPDNVLCDCMVASLSCTIAPNFASNNVSSFADVFQYICGTDASACLGIQSNSTTGTYGAFVGCTTEQALAWAINQYYLYNRKAAQHCDLNGAATTTASSSLSPACQTLLAEAGTVGTGSVTATFTTSTRTGNALSSTISSARSRTTNSATTASSSSSSPSGGRHWSTGAIAGGVVGGIAGLVIIAAAIFFFLRRKESKSSVSNYPNLPGVPELPGGNEATPGTTKPPHEMQGVSSVVEAGEPNRVFVEMDDGQRRPELDTVSKVRHELPAA